MTLRALYLQKTKPMKENKYDDEKFFAQYSRMARSTEGLAGAGEWQTLRGMLPDFRGKRVLDLGCGFGWHCIYAVRHGAEAVTGIDLSERMIDGARERNAHPRIAYLRMAVEDFGFPEEAYDVVISSLTFHYIAAFDTVCDKVFRTLRQGGAFVFSVEHPVFTASGPQQWHRDAAGKPLHWPVDRYFTEGRREAVFLGEKVIKYHRTLTTYLRKVLRAGFGIVDVAEPQPTAEMLDAVEGMRDELRRPMMLIVSARKG